jgi:hypothetical protein
MNINIIKEFWDKVKLYKMNKNIYWINNKGLSLKLEFFILNEVEIFWDFEIKVIKIKKIDG